MGAGRGPLIFHVHTPANETLEAVNEADTIRYLASISDRPRLKRSQDNRWEAEFRLVAETQTAVAVHHNCRPSLSPESGLSINGSAVIHEALVSAGEHVMTCRFASSEPDREADGATSAPSLGGLPKSCSIIVELSYDCPTEPDVGDREGDVSEMAAAEVMSPHDAPERSPSVEDVNLVGGSPAPLRHRLFVICDWDFDTATDASEPTRFITLLQRGTSVYKIDDVFDPGRNEAPRNAEAPANDAEADASGGDDDDAICVVCLSEPKDTVALPCRHLCMCSECAQQVRNQSNRCPMCRSTIERLMTRRHQ
jgi:hypothetical protein